MRTDAGRGRRMLHQLAVHPCRDAGELRRLAAALAATDDGADARE
jgi:hypothetical protein